MKPPTIGQFPVFILVSVFSPSLLAHPGHSHTPGILSNLVHALIGWPTVSALLFILVVGVWWSRFHDAG